MLSDDELDLLITLHAPPIHPDFKDDDDFIELARAIEAAVLPEGWVTVPKEPTREMIAKGYGEVTQEIENGPRDIPDIYKAMLAAAPKAQASPLDLMECLQDRPVEPSKAVQGKCVVQAEKQETVKDEPVAWCVAYDDPRMGRIHSNPSMCKPELEALISRAGNQLELVNLYTRPQPDLTAEVERLELSLEKACRRAEYWKAEHLAGNIRIAALEEAAREAREWMDTSAKHVRPTCFGLYDDLTEVIAKLDAVLGNAEVNGGRLADRPSEAV